MRIIRRRELTRKVGYCLGHINRLERRGEFPERLRLGPRAVGWLEHEVEAWIERRAAARSDLHVAQRQAPASVVDPHPAHDGGRRFR